MVGFAVMFNEMSTFIGIGHTKDLPDRADAAHLGVPPERLLCAALFLPGMGITAVAISYGFANLAGGIASHLLFRKINWANSCLL
jgi:predicted membrane-bound spermidine synthase